MTGGEFCKKKVEFRTKRVPVCNSISQSTTHKGAGYKGIKVTKEGNVGPNI
jgi:hypothetical protein